VAALDISLADFSYIKPFILIVEKIAYISIARIINRAKTEVLPE